MPNRFFSLDADKAAYLRVWLACALLYYPAYWLANSLLWAGPSLIRAAFLRYHLEDLRLTGFGAVAFSSSPSALSDPHPIEQTLWSPARLLPALVAALFLAVVGRNRKALSGLAIATLGQVALLSWLFGLFYPRRLSGQNLLGLGFFFGILCFGLRWMLAGWPQGTKERAYLRRVGVLTAGFVPMPAPLWLWARALWPDGVGVMALGAIASALVALRPSSSARDGTLRPGWKAVGCCAAALAVLIAGRPLAARALRHTLTRARLAENRAAMADVPEIPANLPYPKIFFQKGVNFTAGSTAPYASAGARHMLESLPQFAINAIALVPYGWSRSNSPDVHIQEGDEGWESDEGLTDLSRLAHARGMRVMLKPAIWKAYDMEFTSAADRARWFDQYGIFLEHYARLAKRIHADVFCIGGEFTHLTQYDAEWRKLIARARETYPGPLVYAANFGPEFESVTFWDALDYIGLQEYYPLPENLSTDSVVQEVEAVAQKFRRTVIFTEVGFPSLRGAHRRPWDDQDQSHLSEADQSACYEAVFLAFYNKPWFGGMYWWKIETNGSGGPEDGSHSPWGKPAMDVVKRWYLGGGR